MTQIANLGGGDGHTFNAVGCFAYMSPLAMQLGVPDIDTLPPNLLVAAVTSSLPAPSIARIPIMVFKLPTIVAKITGEPLPFV
jgi:hypothetical protein